MTYSKYPFFQPGTVNDSQNEKSSNANEQQLFFIGEEVIDKNGNNAVVAEMWEFDRRRYDSEKMVHVPLDMSHKVKLKYDSGYTKIVELDGIKKGRNTEKQDNRHILETVYGIDTGTMTEEKIEQLWHC